MGSLKAPLMAAGVTDDPKTAVRPLGRLIVDADGVKPRLRLHDGETPGGVSVGSGVERIGELGDLAPGAASRAALEGVLADAGLYGVVAVDGDIDTGAVPADGAVAALLGEGAIFHRPGAGGRRVQNLPGRDAALLEWGQENLIVWLKAISTGAAISVGLIGDSGMAEGLGGALEARLVNIPGVTVTDYATSGSDISHFLTNTGPVNGTNKALANALAGDHQLYVIGFGTNGALFGRTPEAFAEDLETLLTALRADEVGDRSILLLTPPPMNADTGTGGLHPDQHYNLKLRPIIRAAAEKHECGFFDRNGRLPNAFADLTGSAANALMDAARVHYSPLGIALTLASLWSFVYPAGIAADTSGMIAERSVADTPGDFPKGWSMARMADGPFNGFALTFCPIIANASQFALQFVFAYQDGPQVAVRNAGGSDVWGAFTTVGQAVLAQDSRAVGASVTAYPHGETVMRCTAGFPHNGFVQTTRETATGNNGYQLCWSAAGDALPEMRVFRGGDWGPWRQVGVRAGDLGDYANDAAAAAGGVAVGKMYRNGSVVMVRVA